MDEVEVSTVVYLPPEEVYDFLLDFRGYARYSEYLDRARADGDGGPGTRYALTFSWWKLEYTARSEVTAVDPPNRIEWELVRDLDARGRWEVESAPEEAPRDAETASRVTLRVAFDPDSASTGRLDLPAFVSLSWVVEKVDPLVREEAERVVERIVADLEGRRRDVDLDIHTTSDA